MDFFEDLNSYREDELDQYYGVVLYNEDYRPLEQYDALFEYMNKNNFLGFVLNELFLPLGYI